MIAIEDVETPLEAIASLARSPSRVTVLDAIREEPRTRDDLDEVAGASRVTLDRILDDLEGRGWIVCRDTRYEPTPVGSVVAAEFGRLVSRTEGTGQPAGAGNGGAPEAVEFLARSSNRLEVLAAIRDAPRTRQELKEATDASRATLSRILGELDERGWIDRTNHRCAPTDRGTAVATAFSRVLSNLAAARRLSGVLGWLPTDEFDFELACLVDAAVIEADWDDPTKSIHHVAELVRGADRVRIVGPGATREVAATVRTLTVEHDGTFEGIIDSRTVETVRDDEVLRDHFRAILDSGRSTIRRYDGRLPFLVVAIVDDRVIFCGSDGDGPAHQAVETDDETVRAWAESHFAAIRRDSHPVDGDAFTA